MKKRNLLIVLVLSLVLTACGNAKSYADMGYEAFAPGMKYEEMAMEESIDYGTDAELGGGYSENSVSTTENANTSNRKLIKTVDLTVETKEFDLLTNNLESRISELGGYIERMDGYYGSLFSSYRSEKNATIVARIPVVSLDSFLSEIAKNANITYRSENVTDVTLDYVDIESHKKMLLEEQKRLMEFLEEAETIEDIISIEDRLTGVRYQIDSMESQIRTYDNKIDYSTVTINVQEVIDYTVKVEPEKNALDRMREGFVNSIISIGQGLKEFFIWFVINIPYIILWLLIIIAVITIIRRYRMKNPERKAKYQAKIEAKKAKKELRKSGRMIKKDKTEENELASDKGENSN